MLGWSTTSELMESQMSDKYTVYSEDIAQELLRIGRETYASILDVQRRYPDVDFTSMLHTACHRAATVATNYMEGKPLDRMYSNDPHGPVPKSPEVDARKEAFEDAAQRCRYYLKHQNYPEWEDASEYEKGVMVACGNLEKIMLQEAAKSQTEPQSSEDK